MTEGSPDQDWSERREDDPPSPPSDVDTNVRSESVDSGVETASSDSSFPNTSVSADLDMFAPERQDTPMSQSPALSLPATSSSLSSSPYLPNRSKVEQALTRIESIKDKRLGGEVDEVVRRRPLSSLLSKRHTSDLVRGQRSGSFGLRTSPSPFLLVRQMSEVPRRPQSAIYDRQISDTIPEVFFEAGKSELSPGLQYLEQVCQMLEEYAREQLFLNPQTEAIEETQEEQAVGPCQDVQEVPTCRFLDKIQVEPSPPQRREKSYGHFRHRSASDTNLASLHLRRMKLDYVDHNLSSHDLLETAEDELNNQESQNNAINKSKSYWRLKLSSLRRGDAAKSQQMLPFEKSSTRRRLSQLFRRRRKTGPV